MNAFIQVFFVCMCTCRDEGGSLSSSRIIEVLEAVGCTGALKDKIYLLSQLRELLQNNPAMCEQFFLPHSHMQTRRNTRRGNPSIASSFPTTGWSTAIKVLEQTPTADAGAAEVINGILSILCTVAVQVGIGVENLRGLLGMMIREGRWAPYSACILRALRVMSTGGGEAGAVAAAGGLQRAGECGKVFVFDGLQSGLYLGGCESWAFEGGYAFETALWVADDSDTPASCGRLLLRIMASEPAAVGVNARRAVVEVFIHNRSLGTQFTCFTGTKVKILTQKALRSFNHPAVPQQEELAQGAPGHPPQPVGPPRHHPPQALLPHTP
jgi:hypothetical protein